MGGTDPFAAAKNRDKMTLSSVRQLAEDLKPLHSIKQWHVANNLRFAFKEETRAFELVDGDIKTPRYSIGRSCTSCISWARRAHRASNLPDLKGIKWESQLVDLFANENFELRSSASIRVD